MIPEQTHEEIAAAAGVPLPAVKAHLRKHRTTYTQGLMAYLLSPDCPRPVQHEPPLDGRSKRERL